MGNINFLIQLAPLFILQLPLVFAAAWLAPKMGARRWLWILLTVIPVVGFFAVYVLAFRIAGAVLDKLNLLLERR